MPSVSKKQPLKVYAAEGGDRIIARTDLRTAELHEKAGAWRREFDSQTGALKGFRIVGVEMRRVDMDLPSMRTSAAISREEMELNLAHSHTKGLREADRLALEVNHRAPEDRVERVQAKVRVYAVMGPAKGDILRVWPR